MMMTANILFKVLQWLGRVFLLSLLMSDRSFFILIRDNTVNTANPIMIAILERLSYTAQHSGNIFVYGSKVSMSESPPSLYSRSFSRMNVSEIIRSNFIEWNDRIASSLPTDKAGRKKLLVIDVDGTLYQDSAGIEKELTRTMDAFVHKILTRTKRSSSAAYSKRVNDRLYRKYGSSFHGIIKEGLHQSNPFNHSENANAVTDLYREYSIDVFGNISMDGLALRNDTSFNTGYSGWMRSPSWLLRVVPTKMILASNSPLYHVQRVLSRLQIPQDLFEGIYTPDDIHLDGNGCPLISPTTIDSTIKPDVIKEDANKDHRSHFMKSSPLFWARVLRKYPLSEYDITLIDDNAHNIKIASGIGLQGIKVNASIPCLDDAILKYLDIYPQGKICDIYLPTSCSYSSLPLESHGKGFEFDAVEYLKAKNVVDDLSLNPNVRKGLVRKLADRIQRQIQVTPGPIHLNIVDIGAGLGNMIPHMCHIIAEAYRCFYGTNKDSFDIRDIHVNYMAFEENSDVWSHLLTALSSQGYTPTATDQSMDRISLFSKSSALNVSNNERNLYCHVAAVNQNFLTGEALHLARNVSHIIHPFGPWDYSNHNIDCIVGCCVADLIPPRDLSSWIIQLANNWDTLIYFPITFCGDTRLSYVKRGVPSDDRIIKGHEGDNQLKERAEIMSSQSIDELSAALSSATSEEKSLSPGQLHDLLHQYIYNCIYNDLKLHNLKGHADSADRRRLSRQLLSGKDKKLSQFDIFDAYHKFLRDSGHHLDPNQLVATLQSCGCSLLMSKSSLELDDMSIDSSWVVSSTNNSYLYNCLLRFLANAIAFHSYEKEDGLDEYIQWLRDLMGISRSMRQEKTLMNDFQRILYEACHHIAGEVSSDISSIVSNDPMTLRDSIRYPLTRMMESIAELKSHIERLATDYDLQTEPSHERIEVDDIVLTAKNVDILMQCPILGISPQDRETAIGKSKDILDCDSNDGKWDNNTKDIVKAIEFIGPREVHIIEESLAFLQDNIQDDEYLIQAEYSLVSTGTELKIYRGDFDSTSPIDLTIDSMKDSQMSYPMKYGYCLVGVIIGEGQGKDKSQSMIGRKVFSFSPHSSHVIAKKSSVMFVPDDVTSLDATFLPTIETAVSLVMAASPIIGEKVGVIGQGLIGLFTAAILRQMCPTDLASSSLHIFDVNEDRLEIASEYLKDCSLWNPLEKSFIMSKDELDVAVEVSGHPSGLQTAIDSVGVGGRVVIGSWYGENPVPLRLGLKFHRQGITTISSQVSNIPPHLSGRWTKSRRFELSWRYLKLVEPYRLLHIINRQAVVKNRFGSIVAMEEEAIRKAYNALDKGEATVIVIKY